jgi:uncharacterized protein (TIGR02646 family)
MIKINKNILSIPDSLKIPNEVSFPDGIPRKTKTTHKRRLKLIEKSQYIDENKYNDRYKNSDIRIALKRIYKNKCAFCEHKVEQYHIEHYRPKKIYYWLAFSWDNLLMSCATCNQYKGTNFEITGTQATYTSNDANLNAINSSSTNNDVLENPKFINPEVTNPHGLIKFLKNGNIESDDPRFIYTIETCKLDRDHLNDERRKLLDIFTRDIESALIENTSIDNQRIAIRIIIIKFIRDTKDDELLNDIVKDSNS